MAFDLIGILSFLADLAPLVFLILNRKLLKHRILLMLFIWSVISVAADLLVVVLNDAQREMVAFFSILVEVLFVCGFYFVIANGRKSQWLYAGAGILFAIISIYDISAYPLNGFRYWLAASAAILTMLLSLFVFMDFFKIYTNSFLLDNFQIWIPLAYMIYAAGNLFLFASTEHFSNIFANAGVWNIFFVANIFKNAFFFRALLVARKPEKKNRSLADLDERNAAIGYL
jgi:hypothetical protein